MTFLTGDYVARAGTEQPVGAVESITSRNGHIFATVRWGVADGHVYREELEEDNLVFIKKAPEEQKEQ